jgi:hypothetical protein
MTRRLPIQIYSYAVRIDGYRIPNECLPDEIEMFRGIPLKIVFICDEPPIETIIRTLRVLRPYMAEREDLTE